MKTLFLFLLIVLLALSSSVTFVDSADPIKAEDDFTLVKVTDGVYAAVAKSGGLASGNAGFVVGDDGALVVDTFFTPQAAEELIDSISAETKQPIKYALNTHYHLDHSGGNQVFAARSIPIIAHDNVVLWQTTKIAASCPRRKSCKRDEPMRPGNSQRLHRIRPKNARNLNDNFVG